MRMRAMAMFTYVRDLMLFSAAGVRGAGSSG